MLYCGPIQLLCMYYNHTKRIENNPMTCANIQISICFNEIDQILYIFYINNYVELKNINNTWALPGHQIEFLYKWAEWQTNEGNYIHVSKKCPFFEN